MNEKDQQQILNKLNTGSSSFQANEQRIEDRLTYSAGAIIVKMTHPGGNVATYKVRPRNLSRGGIGFLHGSFCYNDTPCSITLRTIENDTTQVMGKVVRCVHVQGNVHEVGVRFEEPIEVYRYVQAVRANSAGNISGQVTRMRGKVLFVSGSIDDRELFNFIGQSVGLTVETSETSESAEQMILVKLFDLVIIDKNMPPEGGEALMKKLREHGFNGPILALCDGNESDHESLLSAGFARVLPKPFQLEDAVDVVGKFVMHDHSQESGIEPIYSEQWENRKMRPLILNYLERLETRLEEIHRMVMQHQVGDIAAVAQDIRGASGGYGYPQISEVAADLMNASSAGSEDAIEAVTKQYEKLLSLCTAACRVRHEPMND